MTFYFMYSLSGNIRHCRWYRNLFITFMAICKSGFIYFFKLQVLLQSLINVLITKSGKIFSILLALTAVDKKFNF